MTGIFKRFDCYLKVTLVLGAFALSSGGMAASIVGSKHDLSTASGGGNDEICVFCHTPHGANTDLDMDGSVDSEAASRPPAPLWNRKLSTMSAFTMYKSDTLNSQCDNTPSPLTLACLSCHDAATAGGMITNNLGGDSAVTPNDTHFLMNEPNRGRIFNNPAHMSNCSKACHTIATMKLPDFWQVGPDLSNDHPVSLSYPSPAQDPDFHIPPSLERGWSDVKLFNGRVECPSCHNPHDPQNVPFLRKSMVNSGLCTTCHDK